MYWTSAAGRLFGCSSKADEIRMNSDFARFRIKLFAPILNSPLRNVVAQLIDRCLQATTALNVGFGSLFP